jgi:protocatechuate 3,4-dioxygenase beta subunit
MATIVSGLTLRKAPEILATTTTDREGRFAFHDVPAPGYGDVPGVGTQSFPWDLLVRARASLAFKPLTRANQYQPLTLDLRPAARIQGRLLDPAGKPLSGLRVEVAGIMPLRQQVQVTMHPDGYDNRSGDALVLGHSQFAPSAATDADGRFAIDGLPHGMQLSLRVADERFVSEAITVATTEEPQAASTAGAGSELRTIPIYTGPFTVTLQPGHRLGGQVLLTGSGKPAAGAGVSLYVQPAIASFDPVTADAEGRYAFAGLPAGNYFLYAVLPRDVLYLSTTVRGAVSSGKAAQQDVHLIAGIPVSGKVVDQETGRGVAGAVLSYQPAERASRGPSSAHFSPGGTSGPDGTFHIAVPPGKGQLRVHSAPGYVTAPPQPVLTPGQTDTNRSIAAVDAHPDQPVRGLTLALERGLTVEGRIVDPQGKPVPGASVGRQISWSVLSLETFTDAAGRFTLTGLDPGKPHDLEIVDRPHKLAAKSTLAVRPDRKKTVSVDIQLQPAASVVGRVVDEEKKPIPDALIQPQQHRTFLNSTAGVETTTISAAGPSTVTDREGRYTLDTLVSGNRYQMQASAAGFTTQHSPAFDAQPGQTWQAPDLVLLRADQTVAGVVLDGRGQPLAEVNVQANSVRTNLWGMNTAMTDKVGRFRITGLARGPIQVSAHRPDPNARPGQPIRTASARVPSGKQDVKLVLLDTTAAPPVVAVGKPAPAFPVETWLHHAAPPAGRGFACEDYRGKVVLLAFVDDARPSRRLLDRLGRLVREGVMVLRIYELPSKLEDRKRFEEEQSRLSALPAALVAPGVIPGGYSTAFQAFGVRATPALFLIDRQSILRYADLDPGQLEDRIVKLARR